MKLLIILGLMIALAIGFTFLILYLLSRFGNDPVKIYLEDIEEIELMIKTLPVSYENYRRIKDKIHAILPNDNDTKMTTEAVMKFRERYKRYGRKRA